MSKRTICLITGTRAEYGLLYWLMKEIEDVLIEARTKTLLHANTLVLLHKKIMKLMG